MSRETSNPAGRLWALLDEGLRLPDKQPVEEGWSQLLDVGSGGRGLVLRRLGQVWSMPDQIRSLIGELADDIDTSLLLAPLPTIEQALMVPLTGNRWGSVKSALNDTVMSELRFCAEVMHRASPEQEVDDEQVAKLVDEVRALIDVVLAADLPGDLKAVLVHRLREVEETLLQVRVSGVDAIRYAVEATFGAEVLWFQSAEGNERASATPTLTKVAELAQRIYTTVVAVRTTWELGEGAWEKVRQMLELGAGDR